MASPSNKRYPEPNNIWPLNHTIMIHPRSGSRAEKPYPTTTQLSRLLERRRALELGYELPLTTEEAGMFIGFHPKTVERMARNNEIPAHPASGARKKTWRFYASELDEWLRAKVNSHRYPCSPNGKDSDN